MATFQTLQNYLLELGYIPENVNTADETLTISDPDNGISQLVIDCEDGLVLFETAICDLTDNNLPAKYASLLMKNRTLIHGAFCLMDNGKRVTWRDTLQLQNLDLNELEASINALALAMAEHHKDIIAFAG